MLRNNKLSGGALLIAGAAAFAYYKYSKMSAEEKAKLTEDLKEKGMKLYEQYMPEELKNMFSKKDSGSGTASANNHFGEGGGYSS